MSFFIDCNPPGPCVENRPIIRTDWPPPVRFPHFKLQEYGMAPDEIIAHIDEQNRNLLSARGDIRNLTQQEVLHLMNTAAMRGFRFGSDSALSLVQSKLVVKYISEAASNAA
jgi:hypothetical protein